MKLRRGQMVRIEFSDHAEGYSSAIRFLVYGRIASVKRDSITLYCWEYRNHKTPHDQNETRFTIVRAAIHKITRLVPFREDE